MGRKAAVLTMWAVSSIAFAQTPRPNAMPSQVPVPGAPTAKCEFFDIDVDGPIRITAGTRPIPYQFACGHNRPAGVCAQNFLSPGLVVSLGAEKNGWACVTGGDSTSGWVPADRLAPVSRMPRVPITGWVGWWRHPNEAKGVKNDRLLITRVSGTNLLHVSGRAYWYGSKDDVHFGEVKAKGTPIGLYLHAVEPSDVGVPCVVDLKYDLTTRKLTAYDNTQCGGMNVRFSGEWQRFTPK